MTIREIADLAGVSIATVSRVLNGRDDVADETRALVRRVVEEHGYTANRSARGLSAGRTGLVGVLVPLVYPVYFSAILSGATEALYEQDMRVVLSPTGHEHDREVSLLDRLVHGVTDGALIVLPEESSDELERAARRAAITSSSSIRACRSTIAFRPCRQRTCRAPTRRCSTCSGSGTAASPRSPGPTAGSRPRTAGAGITRRSQQRASSRSGARGRGGLRDRRRPRRPHAGSSICADPPTAIFAFNDNLAIGAIQAARTRGLRVPDDLSVVGFDDVEHATIVTPTLTTVRQPLAEMGRTAVSLLMRLLEHQRFETLHVELGDATRGSRVDRAAEGRPRARRVGSRR